MHRCESLEARMLVRSVQGQSCLSWDVEFVDTLMNTRQTQPRLPVPGELYQPSSVSPGFSSVVSECQHVLPSSRPSRSHRPYPARTHTHTHTHKPSCSSVIQLLLFVTVRHCVSGCRRFRRTCVHLHGLEAHE